MIVVADTSPINYLILIEQIDLLPRLYGRVLIPPAVWSELNSARTPDVVRTWIEHPPHWLTLVSLTAEPDRSLDALDDGEREAITLVHQVNADRLIVDESRARRIATSQNINVVGTLGILRDASDLNLIEFPDTLAKLQQTSFFASPVLIQSLIEENAKRPSRS